MRTNIVLIDYENVQPESLSSLDAERFRVFLFLGANQAKLSFELVAAMQKLGQRGEYVKITGNGSNALDFHIAFYIGRISAEDPSAYFHIVSKDTGFEPLIQHLKAQNILAGRVTAISDIPLLKASTSRSPDERAQVVIEKLSQPKATKPRTSKTLSSSIGVMFQKQLSEEDIASVIASMMQKGFISIDGIKVTYLTEGDA